MEPADAAAPAAGLVLAGFPCRNLGLLSNYNPEFSRQAPRRVVLPAIVGSGGSAESAAPPPQVVRCEGTSVLVRELERVHLRGKAAASHKRASSQARAQQQQQQHRKQPRRRQQPSHVEHQGGQEGDEEEQQQQ